MTVQIGDIYNYNEQEYVCIKRNADVFNPCDYGFEPSWISSVCWRGYWCEYEIKKDRESLWWFKKDTSRSSERKNLRDLLLNK